MKYQDHWVVNPEIMGGKPVIRGTRISLQHILSLMANGWSEEQVLVNYPCLKREDILASLEYAAGVLAEEHLFLVNA